MSLGANDFLQEEVIKKKYSGIVPKKPPLISKASDDLFW